MKLKVSIICTLVMLFSSSIAFAESDSQPVVFTETRTTTSGMVYRPFSLDVSPEGTIEDEYLNIDLNSSAYSATIIIYKDGMIVDHEVVLLDTIDGTIGYDLSLYGGGNYKMIIAFSDNLRYEAYFTIE